MFKITHGLPEFPVESTKSINTNARPGIYGKLAIEVPPPNAESLQGSILRTAEQITIQEGGMRERVRREGFAG